MRASPRATNTPSTHLQRFIIVGLLASAVNYSLYAILLTIEFTYSVAYTTGYVTSVLISYFGNKYWSFEYSHTRAHAEMYQYMAVYFCSFVIGLGTLHSSIEWFGINPLVANIGALVVIAATNYVGLKALVFRKR